MNISHDGTTVSFKTNPQELFLTEKSGAKPNTVRIVDNDEYEMLTTHTPKKIGIRCQEERFIRTLTNLHFAKLFGKVIVIFSWADDTHHHSVSNTSYAHTMSIGQLDSFVNPLPGHHSVPIEQGPHNPGLQQEETSSIDERFAAITISNGTLALLQRIAYGRTMNSVIRELYEAYIEKKSTERGPQHD